MSTYTLLWNDKGHKRSQSECNVRRAVDTATRMSQSNPVTIRVMDDSSSEKIGTARDGKFRFTHNWSK